MENKVFNFIKKHHLICENDTVLVAFSGGADSIALLHFLYTYREQLRINVIAAHLNHGLRGAESDFDEEFVRAYCKSIGVPLLVEKAKMLEKEKPKGYGIEAFARKLRYEFLSKCAHLNNAKIATAHTFSDNSETILFHTIRGTGPKGLTGIAPKRENIIRPLLSVSRKEIEAYCQKNKLEYVTDSSNLAADYTRNKIRLHVMPTLNSIHNGAETAIGNIAQDMLEIDAFLYSSAKELLTSAKTKDGYSAETLKSAPIPVLKYALSLLAGPSANRENITSMQKVLYGDISSTTIPNHKNFILKNKKIYILSGKVSNFEQYKNIIFPFSEGEFHFYNTSIIVVKLFTQQEYFKKNQNIVKNGLTFLADYDKINTSAIFRTRRTGDFFYFEKRNMHKSIKKWMIEEKIPSHLRDTIPCLALNKEILWNPLLGISQSISLDSTTKTIAEIQISHAK